jgi:hypothetical protein
MADPEAIYNMPRSKIIPVISAYRREDLTIA